LAGFRIEEPDEQLIPLHVHQAPDPAWRRTVVGCFDFYAAV